MPSARKSFASLQRDCCDCEAMGHVATTGGIIAQNIRNLMVATVKHRFTEVVPEIWTGV